MAVLIHSAGLLLFRRQPGTNGNDERIELLLAHPGGPFWAGKDEWSIPKGELDEGESLMDALEREFIEEIGIDPPLDSLIDLGEAVARAGKMNHIWAAESDLDVSKFHCDSMVVMEWPSGSGRTIEFPENDKAAWFEITTAYDRIFRSQKVYVERLAAHLGKVLY